MRYSHAAAHAGRAELLALLLFGQNQSRLQIHDGRSAPRKFVEQLWLVDKGDIDHHIG